MADAAEVIIAPKTLSCSTAEWQARVSCAALYRLVSIFGWDDLVFTHVTARVPGEEEHFLINPYGFLFEEITASKLVKIDIDGNVLGSEGARVNPQGFLIHSTVHRARPDARFVMHLHTVASSAVAAQRCGLLPITQTAMTLLQDVAYHDYEGIDFVEEERARLRRNIGNKSTVLLRNHGLLTIGSTAGAAFMRTYTLERACRMQVAAQAGGDLIHVAEDVISSIDGRSGDDLVWSAMLRRLGRLAPGYDS